MPWTRDGREWQDPWHDPHSTLNWTRDVAREREAFPDDGYETFDAPDGVWAYCRGEKTCVINMIATRKLWDGACLLPWECRID